ncbi:hypothetical protein LWI29_025552 [Acer saccharum]|uniref:AIG1-type G domain-containing protein n=1 Tax=Acer saccharum TaxID=4024 RepID=A0AA39RNF9_ACESA|nr:hypothetical protein LWI29_025552 [Acer saccharum]
MDERSIHVESEVTPFSGVERTVVLVGRTGNGKSATCNSILGTKAFKSRRSSAGVTSTCKLERTVTSDGQIINVIDTPGLFDSAVESEFIGKEIARCVDLAKDGFHAVLVVLSVRNRFTKEEEAAILSLQTLFSSKITDYMIVVFTGGDELEENEETLEGYLGDGNCPEPLKVELRLRETNTRLEQQLAEEQAARLKVEENARIALEKSEDEIRKLRQKIDDQCAIL